MERTEIIEKLKEILKFSLTNADEIIDKATEESNLYTDFGLSSVGMLYIVISIEELFGISFDNVSFGDFNTVKDVVDYIEKKAN